MSLKFFQLKSYLNYWLDAVDEYSLHSPFLYDFYTSVVKKKDVHPGIASLKFIRKNFEQDHRFIHVTDFGVGSQHLKSSLRKISDIALTSSSPEKYSRLYTRILHHFHCTYILELGTSLGINTLYLAKADDSSQVVTFEGSPETAAIARTLFDTNKARNIRLIEGNIDHVLPPYLLSTEKIDFAFMDANHRFGPTVQYFEWLVTKIHHRSIIILDDIHYSPEMAKAWKAIQKHDLVFGTVDLFRCGIIFFDPALGKQNVVLQF